MERIFSSFKDSSNRSSGSIDPDDPDSYDAYIDLMITDSRDYEGSILAANRDYAQKYYYGLLPTLYPDDNPYSDTTFVEDRDATYEEYNKVDQDTANRSTFVSTDVRDAIMLMLPSLIRLFAATESPVELVPRSANQSDMATQATNYVNYTFWNDNNGFLILYGAFKDAMTLKTGFVKWWTDNEKEIRTKTFTNITAQQIQQILTEDPSAKLVEIGQPVQPPPPPPQMQPPPQAGIPGMGPPGGAPPAGNAPPGMAPPGPPPGMQPGPPPMGPPGGAPPGMPGGPPPGGGPMPPTGPPPGMAPPGPPMGGMPPIAVYDHVAFRFEVAKPLIKIAGVPPEEMRIDRYARTFKESRIVGHERVVPIDELTAMGWAREDLEDYIQSQSVAEFTSEPQMRNPGRIMGTRMGDGVNYGEFYIRADKDGDGVAELRRIITLGEDHKIVEDKPANRIKFALFSVDPISHTIVGDSIADLTMDIQRIKTNLARAVLDSAAESINPKTVINELIVNVDDALNDDLGAVIRSRGDPGSAVAFNNIPFLGQAALPVIEFLNDVLQRRTGLSDAAKGLDPKALQSSTMIGVEAVINGQQERTELVARVLAETGYRDLFAGIYNEICENPSQQRTLKVNGEWTDYDTSTFDASMGVEVNPTLGKGSDTVRLMTLQQIKADQQTVIAQMGLGNPICGLPELYNTQTDMLAIANFKNPSRYFKMPDPAALQQLLSAPKEPDAMTLAAQAQYQKVKADAAQALGDQNIRKAQQDQDNALAMAQLREKTLNDQAKLDLQRQQLEAQHSQSMAQMANQHTQALGKMAADIFKTTHDGAVDIHQTHAQAASDQAIADTQAAAQQTAAEQQGGET
jgi:hypothetical protein